MLEQQDTTARLRATIEEELGSFRPFADVTSAELETMASRLMKAIAPFLELVETEQVSRAA